MDEKKNMRNMKSIIANVININKKYEEIRKIKGENFNIFSILGVEAEEVKTHSNFIYELLNPNGSHNQGSLFLKLFINKVLIELDDVKIDTVKVYQEYLTKKNRRIDFVIETDKYQIGIEMKIYAKDQDNQLLDYMTELKLSKKEPKLYYLTLSGYEASKESTGGEEFEYECISFENHIYDWLIQCIEKSATKPLLREGLVHYKNLISMLTNKISQPMEKEMEELIKTPNEIKAVHTMLNEYPRIWAKKEMEFLNKLDEEIEESYQENTFEFIDEYDIWTDEDDNNYEDIIENLKNTNLSGFALQKKYNNGYSIKFYFQILKGDVFLEIGFYNSKDQQMSLNKSMEKISNELCFEFKNKNYRYKIIEEDIVFFNSKDAILTYDLFDPKKFSYYVSRVAEEIKTKIDYLVNNEKEVLEAFSS